MSSNVDPRGARPPSGTPPGASPPSGPSPRELSEAAARRLERLLDRYPTREALLVPLLHLAEEEFGVLDDASLQWVARATEISFAGVLEAVSFHGSFRREGGHLIRVCRTLSCALRGAAEVRSHIETRLGIRAGETTSDGRFRLEECECLGACLGAPAALVDGERHEGLNVETVDAILEGLL